MDEGTRDLVHYNPISDAILLPVEQIGRLAEPYWYGNKQFPWQNLRPFGGFALWILALIHTLTNRKGLVRWARTLQLWFLLNKKKVSERRYSGLCCTVFGGMNIWMDWKKWNTIRFSWNELLLQFLRIWTKFENCWSN